MTQKRSKQGKYQIKKAKTRKISDKKGQINLFRFHPKFIIFHANLSWRAKKKCHPIKRRVGTNSSFGYQSTGICHFLMFYALDWTSKLLKKTIEFGLNGQDNRTITGFFCESQISKIIIMHFGEKTIKKKLSLRPNLEKCKIYNFWGKRTLKKTNLATLFCRQPRLLVYTVNVLFF